MPDFNWIQFAIGAAAAFGLSFLLHTVDVDRIEATQRSALAAQESQLNAACEARQKITKEANDALQAALNTTATKLAVAKRVHLSHCVVTTDGKLAGSAANGGQHAGQNGISSDWLRDYAAECENYREEVIVLDNFGKAERVQ